jgi:Ca2+/Na+ antiporter
MKCPNCGEMLGEGFNYCPYCEEDLKLYKKEEHKTSIKSEEPSLKMGTDKLRVEYWGKEYKVKKREGLLTLNLSNKGIKDIIEIKGLNLLTDLEVLKLDHNELTEIKGLDALKSLKKLDLSNNKIKKIEGLEQLINLIGLNLERNYIVTIEGLDSLVNLTNLSLYGNKITHVESFNNKDKLKHFFFGSTNPLYNEIKYVFGTVSPQNLKQFIHMSEQEKSERRQKTWEEQLRRKRELARSRVQQKKNETACFVFVFIIGLILTIAGGMMLYNGLTGGRISFPIGATLLIIGLILMGIGSKGECCTGC